MFKTIPRCIGLESHLCYLIFVLSSLSRLFSLFNSISCDIKSSFFSTIPLILFSITWLQWIKYIFTGICQSLLFGWIRWRASVADPAIDLNSCKGEIHITYFPSLQIPNSLGDKFSHWDSQNETLITHYDNKNPETTLNVSYFEKIMSHWQYI